MIILVTGSNGQLGSELKKISTTSTEHDWYFTDVDTLNICNKDDIELFFKDRNIDICINCAAYTAVDKAEDDEEKEKAKIINSDAPLFLADVCKKHNSILIHISTDYVFDGTSLNPYMENDTINPQSVYGKTKADGEINIINSGCSYIIIRTAWLYSSFGNNFVKTMLRLASERDYVNVVDDQSGNPTWAYDLAFSILMIIQRNGKNPIHDIFHFTNEGITNWYNFAAAIFDISNKECKVKPISTKDFGSKAKRPAFSAMDKTKIKEFTGIKIPFWRDSLIKCIEEINNK